jgi:uncharacterized protein DUF6984
MNQEGFRPLSGMERRILDKLISAVPSGSDTLKAQLDLSLVKKIDEFGSLEFSISGGHKYSDISGPLITGQQQDVDTIPSHGPYINFILFLRDGTISELQIYKDDGCSVTASYDPNKFILTSGLPPKK